MMKHAIVTLYRLRFPAGYIAVAILIANAIVGASLTGDGVRQVRLFLVFAAIAVAILCVLLSFIVPHWLPAPSPRIVAAPVEARWLGLNSPASKVPSHGVRAYGQAYAIDIVHDPLDTARPAFGGRMMRGVHEYPAFGQPVFAMIDGTVVRASGWRRDHRARSNALGLIYLMVEGMFREIGGPAFIIGNHVTIRSDDGIYATVAHLQRGSLTVSTGDRITAGMQIGRCGNSGNSSEPHVHAQLMDTGSFWTAQGIPMAFAAITIGDDPRPVDGLPENEQHMTARISTQPTS